MNGVNYESLEEIIDSFITPCNRIMENVVTHKKFLGHTQSEIESILKEEWSVS
jgi:hypothetical protein